MKKINFKKLPIVSILMAIILAIGLILFINAYSKKEAFSQINLWSGKETTITSNNKDTDNDGLKDWEENLYKTDLLNPDTDADGYLDGEEINSGHNPLAKGPGDELIFFPLPIGDKYNITNLVLSESNMQSLFQSYLAQKQEYINDHPEITNANLYLSTINQSTVSEMTRRALTENFATLTSDAEKILSQMPEIFNATINDNQISILEDNSKEAIESYLDKISSIMGSDSFMFKSGNIEIIIKAFENDTLPDLDEFLKTAKDDVEQIRNISTPSSLKEIHKELLSLFVITRNVIISLRGANDDFLKAYFALQEFGKLPDKWNDLINKILLIKP